MDLLGAMPKTAKKYFHLTPASKLIKKCIKRRLQRIRRINAVIVMPCLTSGRSIWNIKRLTRLVSIVFQIISILLSFFVFIKSYNSCICFFLKTVLKVACPVCEKMFSKGNLRMHQKVHDDTKDAFCCPYEGCPR